LEEIGNLESTKDEIEVEIGKIALVNIQPSAEETTDEPALQDESVPLSPTTKLRQKMQARQQRMETQLQQDRLSAVKREMLRLEI
jgi:hypothetical protein